MRKIFVLDTNILIHDPVAEGTIAAMEVIKEILKKK